MDTTVKTVELTIQEADMALLKRLVKKLGWSISEKGTKKKLLPNQAETNPKAGSKYLYHDRV